MKTVWALYWPWVMFWSLLHDFITHIFQTIIDAFHGVYTKITDFHWKRVEANMPTFAPEEPNSPPPDENQHGRNRSSRP